MTFLRLTSLLLFGGLASCASKPEVQSDLPELPAPKLTPKPAPAPRKPAPVVPRTTPGFVDPDTTTLMGEKERKTVVLPPEVDLPSLPSEKEATGVQALPTPFKETPGSNRPTALEDLTVPKP